MKIIYKQPQFELFPSNSSAWEDVNKPGFLLANLTLSTESIVILSILIIMVGLLSFSWGVERGKHLVAQAMDERVSAAWNVGGRIPAVMPAVLVPAVKSPAAVQSRAIQGNAGFVRRPVVKTIPAVKAIPAKAAFVMAPPAGAKRFTVQVSSNKTEAYAQREAMDFKAKGFQSFLIKKGDFWLVCLGNFSTQGGANDLLNKIQSKNHGAAIRRF